MPNPRGAQPASHDFAERARASGRPQAAAGTCHFCAGPTVGEVVDAGGNVGVVHRSCLLEWDRLQEALEVSLGWHVLPDPGESRTELELEMEQAADRAA